MKCTMGILLLLAGTAMAGDAIQEAQLTAIVRGMAPVGQSSTGTSHQAPLPKSGALTSTSYNSTYFNIKITCPSGWTIANFDSNATWVTFNVVKSGRNNVSVFAMRNATATEAALRDPYSVGLAIKSTYNVSATSPTMETYIDTAVTGEHVSYGFIGYTVGGNQFYYDMSAASTSIYSAFIAYSATESDYDLHGDDYDAVGENLDFVSTTGIAPASLPKGSSGITMQGNTVLNPGGLKIEFLNAQGRKQRVSSEKRIELDPSQKMFLKVHP